MDNSIEPGIPSLLQYQSTAGGAIESLTHISNGNLMRARDHRPHQAPQNPEASGVGDAASAYLAGARSAVQLCCVGRGKQRRHEFNGPASRGRRRAILSMVGG